MSKWAREMLVNQALAAQGRAPLQRGSKPGVSKPKPIDPDQHLQREIVGRATVYLVNRVGKDAMKEKVFRAMPAIYGERWNRLINRRIYDSVSPDTMFKIARALGLRPLDVCAEYAAMAKSMDLPLDIDTVGKVDERIIRVDQEFRRAARAHQVRHLEGAPA